MALGAGRQVEFQSQPLWPVALVKSLSLCVGASGAGSNPVAPSVA